MTEPLQAFLSTITPSDRKLIQMSVHLNPILVAVADGNYSLRESTAFAESLRALTTEEIYRPLLPLAGNEDISDAALRVMLETHSPNIEGYLTQVAGLLAQMPSDVAEAYRRFAIFAIVKVAQASRSGLFGLVGARIDQSEKRVMKRMVEVLALPVDDAMRGELGM